MSGVGWISVRRDGADQWGPRVCCVWSNGNARPDTDPHVTVSWDTDCILTTPPPPPGDWLRSPLSVLNFWIQVKLINTIVKRYPGQASRNGVKLKLMSLKVSKCLQPPVKQIFEKENKIWKWETETGNI